MINYIWLIFVLALIGVIVLGVLIIGFAIAESEPVIFPDDEWEEDAEKEPPYFDSFDGEENDEWK